jgi:cytochrome c oxidase cbb3-type subunit 2
MNRSNRILLGLLVVFLMSWLAFVAAPYVQIGRLLPDIDDVTKDQTPPQFPGIADEGRAVYAANGCVYCHSQQVQSRADGADIDRQWGERRTVARDYLDDRAVYLGSSRLGPDLANVGVRKDANDPAKYSESWFYAHLYDPQIGGSEASADRSKGAIVPSHDARALVAYLLALKRSSYKLPEAPEEAAEQP